MQTLNINQGVTAAGLLPVFFRSLTALPAPHLPLIRHLQLVGANWRYTYIKSRTGLIPCQIVRCIMQVFSARFSHPACSMLTLPVPHLPVKPDSRIICLPSISVQILLCRPARYRPCLLPTILLNRPASMTSIANIYKVNKVILFRFIMFWQRILRTKFYTTRKSNLCTTRSVRLQKQQNMSKATGLWHV